MISIEDPDHTNTQKGNKMLKALALLLTAIFLMVGSDYAGRNGLSIWLAIPLTIGYVWMLGIVVKALIQDAKRR